MTIHILNPNSLEAVTAAIDRAVDPFRALSKIKIATHTLAEGPPGIETQAHVDLVVAPLLRRAAELEDTASAFVIACYSDPGLAALREQSRHPVFGIAEAAILTALTMGQRFGVISILNRSIPRHRRAIAAMGLSDRLAGDRALDLGVAALSDATQTSERLRKVGRMLCESDGAEVIVLGCAGMADYRQELARDLGCPVIDPNIAATALAIGRVMMNQT